MNFDRNTVIGFIVLAILFIAYFTYNTSEQQAYIREKARQDSIAQANQPIPDTVALRQDSLKADTMERTASAGGFSQHAFGTEREVLVENEILRIAFTNRGGQPIWVELKGFESYDSTPLRLAAGEFDKITYTINTEGNRTADVANFFFSGGEVTPNADGSQTITFQLRSEENGAIVHQYVIHPNNYMMDFTISLEGANRLITGNTLNLVWQNRAVRHDGDVSYERQYSQISFREDGEHDFYTINNDSRTFNRPVGWVAVKQRFFASTLIAKNNFTGGRIEWVAGPENSNMIVEATATMQHALPGTATASVPLAFYFGPADYKILKNYGTDMEDMVNLGSGIFAFVKYINRGIILPLFDMFSRITSNYGIVIILLTIVIRLMISPLTYKSYLSGAKMKVLRPEIAQLKEKYGSDQQQISMEQMKLFREAGVNPLGGCIPALLQIPIFFALFSFFNSSVALRGESFLWAKDLSQPDSILSLPFSIPLYGDYVSLFTITAVITSFFISIYSMNMAPDQSNPVMKYMPYFFPIILLFVFNRMPAGLTWYYTVSNLITLVLQFVIQNYIINHDKILAKIQENKKKPKTKSKWQERMEQMQEQQKKMKEMQQKGKR